ncbi:hypothetical protein WR25_15270 isoform A [Diploscapter pachys]|uniref:Methyl-CpG binding protein 2/3 C-terminal domain-containing protein n=1 Tax=Diploscapter pachys TaxID=2018661 RepID=A0A2A2KFQ8_9BILA|nr:hypothetical protein WR25_15270 isoform A [Diploscapter pachys]
MFLNLKNSKQVSESFQCNFCKKINKIKKFQLMWAKSLEGLTCSVPARMGDKSDVERDEYIEESLQLAGRLTKICDAMSDRGVAAHICSTVHHPAQMGVYGQKASKEKLAENLLLNYDPNQPMIQWIDKITLEEDIRAQEKRVLDARKRLQEVLKHFG